jgi:hypothetical protein
MYIYIFAYSEIHIINNLDMYLYMPFHVYTIAIRYTTFFKRIKDDEEGEVLALKRLLTEVYTYVYAYVYIYVYTYIYISICIYICIHIHRLKRIME